MSIAGYTYLELQNESDDLSRLHSMARKQRRPNFTAAEKVAITDAYHEGEPLSEIAERFNSTRDSIGFLLDRIGVKRTRPGGTPLRLDTATTRSMWDAGDSVFVIAKTLGASHSAVKRHLEAAGVKVEARPAKGAAVSTWNPTGRRVDPSGYIYVRRPDCGPASELPGGRYILEHRAVMAEAIGRPLESHEQVHHINGDQSDNRLGNLQLRATNHGPGVVHRCRACGSHDVEAVEL